ncbi:MAG: hypothetical protein SFV18_06905 [Bryobacteraceae bacterium]|nr:hypothetical protein [Bryobacteraceae bacterium]
MALAFLVSAVLHAQVFYDPKLDRKAQETLKQAEALKNQPVFDRQLRNLSTLTRQDTATYLMDAKRRMRATVGAWSTWEDVRSFGEGIDRRLATATISETEISSLRVQLDAARAAAEAALDRLNAAKPAEDPALSAVFDQLGEAQSVFEFGVSFLGGGNANAKAAVDGVSAALDRLKVVYETYANKIAETKTQLASIPGAERTVIETNLRALKIDEQHIKSLAEIAAREEFEKGEIRAISKSFLARMDRLKPTGELTKSIAAANAETKEDLTLGLNEAAALAARQDMPGDLAKLRRAQEEHRYSILRSGVMARAYELVVATGMQRLALYHAGGIKMEQVSQLVFTLYGLAVPPIVALK